MLMFNDGIRGKGDLLYLTIVHDLNDCQAVYVLFHCMMCCDVPSLYVMMMMMLMMMTTMTMMIMMMMVMMMIRLS